MFCTTAEPSDAATGLFIFLITREIHGYHDLTEQVLAFQLLSDTVLCIAELIYTYWCDGTVFMSTSSVFHTPILVPIAVPYHYGVGKSTFQPGW